MKELKIAIRFDRIKDNIDVVKDFDLTGEFNSLLKDILLSEFNEEQFEKNGNNVCKRIYNCISTLRPTK